MGKMKFKDEDVGNSNIKSWKEMGGSWLNYKRYLSLNNALAPGLSLSPPEPAKPKEPGPKVPWFGKMWNDFTNEHKAVLKEHLQNLGKHKAKNYVIYLHNHANAPKDLLYALGVSFE